MHNLTKRLEKKGWEKKEIDRAVLIIQKAKANRKVNSMFFERKIYFMILVVILACNFAVSIAMVPVILTIKGISIYFILAILGLAFGLLFEIMIRTVEHLEQAHHFFLALFIPLTAFANFFLMARLSSSAAGNLQNYFGPISVALAYSAAFSIPYLVYRFILKIEYYSSG